MLLLHDTIYARRTIADAASVAVQVICFFCRAPGDGQSIDRGPRLIFPLGRADGSGSVVVLLNQVLNLEFRKCLEKPYLPPFSTCQGALSASRRLFSEFVPAYHASAVNFRVRDAVYCDGLLRVHQSNG